MEIAILSMQLHLGCIPIIYNLWAYIFLVLNIIAERCTEELAVSEAAGDGAGNGAGATVNWGRYTQDKLLATEAAIPCILIDQIFHPSTLLSSPSWMEAPEWELPS